ncbi:MAG TPA: hypothetical protein VFZ33_16295 [Chitinophagaceae bacterium]
MSKSKLLLLLIYIAFLVTSCKKTDSEKDSATANSTTEQIAKIETDWDGISKKNDNDLSSPKEEFAASPAMIKENMDRVNQKYQEYVSNLGTGSGSVMKIGNWVGVIKNGSGCNGYDEIEIYMDCEDANPQTKWDGGLYRPSTWVIGNNARMKFCIVPSIDFHAFVDPVEGGFRYAVLRVTTNLLSDAFETNRYFDNEDNNNQNTAWYQPWSTGGAGYSIKGSTNANTSVYRTYIDGNSLLSFHVFDPFRLPQTTFVQWPDFAGMSYGVFGCCIPVRNTSDPNYWARFYTDDQDQNNFNYFSADEDVSAYYPQPGYSFDASNPLNAIVNGVYKAGTFFYHGGYIDTEVQINKVR